MNLRPVGTRAVLVEVGGMDAVHRLWAAVRAEPPEGLVDAVAGAETVLLTFAETAGDPLALAARLPETGRARHPLPRRTITLPVRYDGPDLEEVAEACGMAVEEVVRRHTAASYTVGFLGFSPGFAYLFGGDPGLAVSRRPAPRTVVPAGSVAIAGGMTAVYPQATPGGWRLIGRTDAVMFDPYRADPALLAPGDEVRLHPVERIGPPPRPDLSRRVPSPRPDRASVEVLEPGLLLTVQDRGRTGWAHVGVPVAGAADRSSAARANSLVGNEGTMAVLEATGGGCRFRVRADRLAAVTGAWADVTVDGLPARRDVGLHLRSGAELTVGPCRRGVRVYVAFAGGLDVEQVLGSRSTDTLSGLGPAPLRAGDRLPLGPVTGAPPTRSPVRARPPGPVDAGAVIEVRARLGPREDWLTADGIGRLGATEFVVAAASDRTGVRLGGARLGLARRGDIPSEGMAAGAVQLPPGGEPIVLMRNHPPTGGYPVVAVVDDEGVDALAQAAPGDRVRFRLNPARSADSAPG